MWGPLSVLSFDEFVGIMGKKATAIGIGSLILVPRPQICWSWKYKL